MIVISCGWWRIVYSRYRKARNRKGGRSGERSLGRRASQTTTAGGTTSLEMALCLRRQVLKHRASKILTHALLLLLHVIYAGQKEHTIILRFWYTYSKITSLTLINISLRFGFGFFNLWGLSHPSPLSRIFML